MNKKGSLELSVNAIVILIIALAILGLVIGFAVTRFRALQGGLQTTETTPPASASSPITFPGGVQSLILEKGVDKQMQINVYNGESADVTGNIITATCAPDGMADTTFSAPPTTISAGSSKAVAVLATVAGAEKLGKKSCEFKVGVGSASVSTTVFIEVR